jgi:predicted acetylornithine/succinylornithine family transaminase
VSLAQLQTLEREWLVPTYARLPVEFVRGEGARLWDGEGDEYLDFLTGISVSSVGHCHPAVVAAIREQAGSLIHVGNLFYSEPSLRLAGRLAARSLGGKVFFTNSGAEAVEAALKLARKRRAGGEVVSVQRAFHGRTFGALSATPQESKQAPFAPLVPGFRAVEPEVDAVREAVSEDTAAVLLEPVQGEGGIHVLDDDLLRAARAACDATGATLIFDEIQCGMGRTGTLWAWQESGVRPDAMTVAKPLGGGLPIGALITSPELGDVLSAGDHGSTFAGGPLVTTAALAVLDVIDDAALLHNVRERGAQLAAGLAALPGTREVRGRGLMLAIELDGGAPELVRRALLEQRLVLNATGPTTVRFLPPLTVGADEVDEALERLRRLLR